MSDPRPLSQTPLVSVIVAVHDVADFAAQAIESLKAQTLSDFEALVIDDGSTDGSGSRALQAAGDDPRFRVIRQDNAGLSGARNRGLDEARGDFVAFLDGDDAFDPGFLATLHAAILRDGTDWAACGISLSYPDGRTVAHPALHGSVAPGPGQDADRVIGMTDARAVARVFPSAWNKLYRRSFLADLRFPAGSWFEDHEVFWALAVQGRPLSYSPDPLVLHRRDRPGQITGRDDDRVFDQFTVLDRLAPLIRGSGLAHADAGFARLATRLIHERALVLRDRERRARFLAQAWDFLIRHDIAYTPCDDPEVSRALPLAWQGVLPLSVVVLGGGARQPVLDALDRQGMSEFELVVVAPADCDLPKTLPCGHPIRRIAPGALAGPALAADLQGRLVVLLNADERPLPDGLLRLVNLIETSDAALAFAGLERDGRGYHDGWCDNTVAAADLARLDAFGGRVPLTPERVLAVHPVLGNRIMRRSLLAQLDVPVAADFLAVQRLILAAGLQAGEAGINRFPVVHAPDFPGAWPDAADLPACLRAMTVPGADRLPAGWQGVLFWRIERYRALNEGQSTLWRWARLLWRFWRADLPRLSPSTPPDPETPRWVRAVLRLTARRGAGDVASR